MQNKINILLDLYGTYYYLLIDTEVLTKALEGLPPDTQLEPKFIKTALGMAPVEKTVGERIVELARDHKILVARVEAIKKEIMSIPGGKEALKDYVWEAPKNE